MKPIRSEALLFRVSSRTRSERGASAVEFAIILPVFLMITFGMLTGGLAYNTKNNLTHAAREAARYGATLPVDQFPGTPGPSWAASIKDRLVDNAAGDIDESKTGHSICVALVSGDPGAVVSITGSPYRYETGGGAGRCFDDGGADGQARVQVSVERPGSINAVLFFLNLTLESQADARYEGKIS
ncbi:MAG TPA: TadE family protein [Actinomycetota bacterium]